MLNLWDRIPAPIQSLWKAEIELRRGLWASILRRGQTNPHYQEARRLFDEALETRASTPKPAEWGSAEHVADTVEQDRTDNVVTRPHSGDAPRF